MRTSHASQTGYQTDDRTKRLLRWMATFYICEMVRKVISFCQKVTTCRKHHTKPYKFPRRKGQAICKRTQLGSFCFCADISSPKHRGNHNGFCFLYFESAERVYHSRTDLHFEMSLLEATQDTNSECSHQSSLPCRPMSNLQKQSILLWTSTQNGKLSEQDKKSICRE